LIHRRERLQLHCRKCNVAPGKFTALIDLRLRRPSVRELAKGSEYRIPYQFRVIAPIIDLIETNRHAVRIKRH
jgi:hypothetical protein